MADIAGRFQIEAGLASDLATEMRPMADQLAVYVRANPGNPNVPDAYWQELKERNTRLLALWLLITWETSSRRHGWTGQAATTAGVTWARPRAETTAQSVVDTARQRLDTATREWQARMEAAKTSSVDSTPTTSTPETFTIDQGEIDQRVEEILGPKSIERTAVTEVSNAVTDASEAAMDAQGLKTEQDYWHTVADVRVCHRCSPLNGKPRSVWQAKYDGGPPAHPNCRCWIGYENEASPTGDHQLTTDQFIRRLRGHFS